MVYAWSMQGEFDNLKVLGETNVGWDAATPPNETVDADGRPFPLERGFGVPDPKAPAHRMYDDPEVERLRAHLEAHNGIRGLEICEPHEVDRAARIFRRDGFVVVRDLLSATELERWREGCARVLKQILEIPGFEGRRYVTETGRLPHRYSYGTSSASRQLLHEPEWVDAIVLETTRPILEAIFGSENYKVAGAGGDLCLPGAIEYQHLHADLPEDHNLVPERLAHARDLGLDVPDEPADVDLKTARLIVEQTAPLVTINFLMSDLTWENGPIRQIPGSHASAAQPPSLASEPEWMKLSTLVGAKAGAGVFRDNRAWHGATPNLGREIRAMPNVEYAAPWRGMPSWRPLPCALFETLCDHGRHLAREVVAEPGVWPPGAGVMHPLSSERKKARKAAGA
jgi:hypothetical protein